MRKAANPKAELRKIASKAADPRQYWKYYFLSRFALTQEERQAYGKIVSHLNEPPRDTATNSLADWGADQFLSCHPELLQAHEEEQRRLDELYGEWPPRADWEGPLHPAPDDIPAYAQQHIIYPEEPRPYAPTEPLPQVREATPQDLEQIGKLLDQPYISQGPPIVRPMTKVEPSGDGGVFGWGDDGSPLM